MINYFFKGEEFLPMMSHFVARCTCGVSKYNVVLRIESTAIQLMINDITEEKRDYFDESYHMIQ